MYKKILKLYSVCKWCGAKWLTPFKKKYCRSCREQDWEKHIDPPRRRRKY